MCLETGMRPLPTPASSRVALILTQFFSLSLRTRQAGEEVRYKIRDNAKLSEVFDAYADRKGVPPASLRLLWKGTKVCPCLTPQALGMRDRDARLDCVGPVEDLDAPIVVRIRDEVRSFFPRSDILFGRDAAGSGSLESFPLPHDRTLPHLFRFM